MGYDFNELVRWRLFLDNQNRDIRVVATNGCFDILHAGHISMLEAAKQKGDYLVVGINSDRAVSILKGPRRPINDQNNRAKVLGALRCVDFVCIFDSPRATEFLKAARPDVYVKASDYNPSNVNNEEAEALQAMGTQVVFVDFEKGLSTTNILTKV